MIPDTPTKSLECEINTVVSNATVAFFATTVPLFAAIVVVLLLLLLAVVAVVVGAGS